MNEKEIKELIKKEVHLEEEQDLPELQKFNSRSIDLPKKHQPRIVTFKKAIFVLSSFCFILILGILVHSLNNQKPSPNEKPNPNSNDQIDYFNYKQDIQYVIYQAIEKTLQNSSKKRQVKLSKTTNYIGDDSFYVEYPFDYIRITNPMQFNIYIPDDHPSIIKQICGTGDITVLISDIDFYSENNGVLTPCIQEEKIIIFKSPLGIYSCLLDGFGVEEMNFSGHKFIKDQAVVKESVEPCYRFKVSFNNQAVSDLNVARWDATTGDYYESVYVRVDVDSFMYLETSVLYELMDFQVIPTETIETTISEIGENYLKLNYNNQLITGYVTENTEIILVDGTSGTFLNLLKDQFVQVTYAKYYQDYQPNVLEIISLKMIQNQTNG